MVQVVGSEGYYVQGMISENRLSSITPGMMLNGLDYDSGMSFMAEVKQISPYPIRESYSSANTSMYPFIAYIEDGEGLSDYSEVELTPADDGESASGNGIYINKPFVRMEDGHYYVMIADEDGRLKKQVIQVSGMLYGEYYKTTSGITSDDMIAFPYGKNAREGAMTEEGSLDQLYQ